MQIKNCVHRLFYYRIRHSRARVHTDLYSIVSLLYFIIYHLHSCGFYGPIAFLSVYRLELCGLILS
jgi:hypothetical protein